MQFIRCTLRVRTSSSSKPGTGDVVRSRSDKSPALAALRLLAIWLCCLQSFTQLPKMENTGVMTLMVISAAIVIRWSVSLNPYSGAGKPPMFGDYEAQRHWMEVTYHLPVKEWYHNTTNNDLQYWGLDYPPLTAYHSWLCGYISNKINPEWVALHTSRGYENHTHKLFMRYTVLAADLLVFIPAVLAFFFWTVRDRSNVQLLISIAVALAYPGLILIDYGHFQYNNISLGFTTWAVVAMATGHELLGSMAFVFALNYKQMELYHSVPFFCYLLGRCLWSRDEIRLWKLTKLGAVVLASFALCWIPFVSDVDHSLQVLNRIFPFARGLFEDKVSNVWCAINVVVKLKQHLTQGALIKVSLASTVLCLMPSSVDLLLRPSLQKFKYALINSSLVFFLFSYQVHEKSILIAAMPVCLLIPEHPFTCTWFLLLSVFSMLPLLIKDGLLLATIPLAILFFILSEVSQSSWVSSPQESQKRNFLFSLSFCASMCGVIVLTVCGAFVQPPARYPDLWPVLVSLFSCGHFVVFLVAFHYLQIASQPGEGRVAPVTRPGHGGPLLRESQGIKSKKGGKRKQKAHKAD